MRAEISSIGLLIVSTLGLANAAVAQTATADADEPYAEVIVQVEGDDSLATLRTFHRDVLVELKGAEAATGNLQCAGCEALEGDGAKPELNRLTYLFPVGDTTIGEALSRRCLSAITAVPRISCHFGRGCAALPPPCYVRPMCRQLPIPYCSKRATGACVPGCSF
jgi:hypothetical protein